MLCIEKTPSFRQAPNVYNGDISIGSTMHAKHTILPKVFTHNFYLTLMFLQWSKNVALGLRTVFATRGTRRARLPGPQKPPFLACQKVAPPPCKKPPFLHFPRRKVGIFDRFVHENAHF